MAIKPGGLDSDDWAVSLAINGISQAVGFVLLVWDLVAPEYDQQIFERMAIPCVAIGVSPNGLQITGAF